MLSLLSQTLSSYTRYYFACTPSPRGSNQSMYEDLFIQIKESIISHLSQLKSPEWDDSSNQAINAIAIMQDATI